jgi:hypothetical protein
MCRHVGICCRCSFWLMPWLAVARAVARTAVCFFCVDVKLAFVLRAMPTGCFLDWLFEYKVLGRVEVSGRGKAQHPIGARNVRCARVPR